MTGTRDILSQKAKHRNTNATCSVSFVEVKENGSAALNKEHLLEVWESSERSVE